MSVDPIEIMSLDLNTATKPLMNTGAKRLTEPDVQTVFSCLWNNQQPPQRLKFRIIRVPQNGLKLSPPSFEFDDGLYVLLRSPMNELAPVPSEHTSALMTDSDLASLPSCPWSLSGPQYPKHDGQKVQQRYCYPRGNPGYSNGKGGAMWTMVDQGREDIDCRILHVYHSSKRAGFVSNSESAKSTNTEGKRKHSGSEKKKRQARKVASAETVMRSPGLLRGDLLSSPCHSQLSINLDADLDFNSTNLFDAYSTPVDQHFSFMPIRGTENHSIEDLMSNNAAFINAVAKHSTSSGYLGRNAHAMYPYAQGGRNAHDDDWEKPTSQVTEFSKKLTKVEDDLLADVHRSSTVEQTLKLQLLQSWAKVIAQRPLQSRRVPALEAAEASSTIHSNAGSQKKVKMESPGTPTISP
ncbi:hypothetical protein ACHAXA_002750 [Cyclostephanos tholiformis]|uniref:Uncharacterized protein n=1 Tax=Cyclostephanos tholiformis TaxID=382380 RepID=A0ABD3RHD4_9STRA